MVRQLAVPDHVHEVVELVLELSPHGGLEARDSRDILLRLGGDRLLALRLALLGWRNRQVHGPGSFYCNSSDLSDAITWGGETKQKNTHASTFLLYSMIAADAPTCTERRK